MNYLLDKLLHPAGIAPNVFLVPEIRRNKNRNSWDIEGFDTINSVVHLGYLQNRDSFFSLFLEDFAMEEFGSYSGYLEKTKDKINEIRGNGEPIFHFIELAYWRYPEPIRIIGNEDFIVFTENLSSYLYSPEQNSFFLLFEKKRG